MSKFMSHYNVIIFFHTYHMNVLKNKTYKTDRNKNKIYIYYEERKREVKREREKERERES